MHGLIAGMKLKILFSSTVAASLLFAVAGCQTSPSQDQLKAQAKITEAQAREIAQAKVPNGTIKEAELENEKGKLIWSFDMATPGAKDITEVNIDAITGEVIAVAVEKN